MFVSDKSSIKPKYKEMLDNHGIRWEEGQHTEADILNADEIVKSPGIPDKAPIIQLLKKQGTPIISEIEFAGRYTDSKMICITGSNGKTTTTMLTYHILKEAGVDVGLAGNVGNSLALQVAEDPHAVLFHRKCSVYRFNNYLIIFRISLHAVLICLGEWVKSSLRMPFGDLTGYDRVIVPENEGVVLRLILQDAELSVYIILHLIVITVQMIRCYIQ